MRMVTEPSMITMKRDAQKKQINKKITEGSVEASFPASQSAKDQHIYFLFRVP
jgi:hypothetical protein